MSIGKQMRKKVDGFTPKQFPNEMYNNLYGSLAICAYMFTPESGRQVVRQTRGGKERSVALKDEIRRRWFRARRNQRLISWTIADDDFIPKTLAYFGVEKPDVFPIALVRGRYNALFAPFVGGRVLPLREDGFMGVTLSSGKVYPVDWSEGAAE